jgi:Helix-turn-helix domain
MEDQIPLGEAARLLSLSKVGVYKLVERGELHRTKTPLGWAYSRAEVEVLAARRAELYERGPKGWPRKRREALSA